MTDKQICKNQFYSIIADALLYLITISITGSYLAKLTGALGFSDSLTATITSAVALGYSFQLLAIPLFRKGRAKTKIVVLYTVSTLMFSILYMTPFFQFSAMAKTVIFISFFLLGNFILNAVFPARTSMFMSFVEDRQRGRFTALKEAVSLIFGIAFQFSLASIIDKCELSGNLNSAFKTLTFIIGGLTVAHIMCIILTKENKPEEKKTTSLFKDLKEMLHSKTTLPIILLGAFWSISYNISVSFYGTYQIKELGFSMAFVAVQSVVMAVARICASVFLGKYADKHSFAKMLKICYLAIGLAFLVMVFSRPSNGYVTYTLYSILSAIAFGGINSAEINIVYDYVEPEKRMNVISVKQTLYGLSGFGITLLVTPLVNYIQQNGNMLLGMNLYAQQVLSAISFVCVLLLIVYVNKIILKIKPHTEK